MVVLVAGLICAAACIAEPLTDGPYVFHVGARSEARWVCAGEVKTRRIDSDRRILPVCGQVPTITLNKVATLAADILPQPRRWAAVSDVHGQAGLLLRLLTAQRIVDGDGHWRWGKGVLVIVGDVVDRGPEQVEALWTIYRLAQEAKVAGGRVELLLGNHEIMLLAGDLRYLHPKYAEVARLLGRSYDLLFAADSELGAWLRRRATLLKVGDTLFVHGGLHPAFAGSKLDPGAINRAFRARLGASRDALALDPEGRWLLGGQGPAWYRGYFEPGQATQAEVEALLASADVARMVVGHTTVDAITSLYRGRIIGIDAALKNGERGELLIRERGGLWRGLIDGQRFALPSEDQGGAAGP